MGKLGLVLEGGGMRGIYTAGVLDFFIDHNIYTDGVIGVSAGACHACSYASKQRGRAFRTNTDYIKDKRYMSMRSLITTGDLFGAKFVYDDIPNKLDIYDYETFNKGEIKLYAVCSNIETGKAEYIQCINMVHDVIYVRASASLPLLSKVVEVDGKKLLDGGACDSIPIKRFQEMGYDKNIVVLTQCKEYRKGKNNLLPIIRKVYRKYPKFIAKLEKRHVEYNRTLNELSLMEKEGSVFVIRPSAPVEISRLEKNVDKLKALYDQGYQDAQEQYAALKEFMEN
ncbi:patatin-like phospholipase family protein [Amedibacillus sp. YH-ame10]